jgi:hypothetical protein
MGEPVPLYAEAKEYGEKPFGIRPQPGQGRFGYAFAKRSQLDHSSGEVEE